MKFRKKPVEIEAVEWTGGNGVEVARFLGMDIKRIEENISKGFSPPQCFIIQTLEGDMLAREGDWIVRGTKGEFYPVKPDIFAQCYEAV